MDTRQEPWRGDARGDTRHGSPRGGRHGASTMEWVRSSASTHTMWPTVVLPVPVEVPGASASSSTHPPFELPDLVLAAQWSGDGGPPSSVTGGDSGGGGGSAAGRSGSCGSGDQLVHSAAGRAQAEKERGELDLGGDGSGDSCRAGSHKSTSRRGWSGPSLVAI
jgi:hypothetical protein